MAEAEDYIDKAVETFEVENFDAAVLNDPKTTCLYQIAMELGYIRSLLQIYLYGEQADDDNETKPERDDSEGRQAVN